MDAGWKWILSIAAAALLGGGATLYFRGLRMRRDETAAGIAALSAVSWRTFFRLVLDALARRGYRRTDEPGDGSGDGDCVLQRDGRQWLLSCKHGSAFVLGRAEVNALANQIGMRGAEGGFLVTQGMITGDAAAVAALQRIELLDGQALWPELRDGIPASERAAIRSAAARRARQRILLFWLLALLAGIAVFMALPAARHSASAPPPAREPAAAASRPSASPPPPAAVGTVEEQRAEAVRALTALPEVGLAAWSSRSTLEVQLLTVDGDAFARICPLVERHPAVATARIQLTPPADSGARVRFRQCRTY